MRTTDSEDTVRPPEVDTNFPVEISCKGGQSKCPYIEDQGTSSSSDEAEFSASSSSASSSEKDFPLNNVTNCKRNKVMDKVKGRDHGTVLDLGYDSASSNDGDVDEQFGILPKDLMILIEGINRSLPAVPQDDPPDWFDAEKFKIGQQFALKYYFGVNFAEMLSLFMLFSFESNLKPLMFTGKSGTPVTSFKRYLSTVLRVRSWYENDVFTAGNFGYNNIRIVRGMHSSVSKNTSVLTRDQLNNEINTINRNYVSSLKDAISEDFSGSLCPFIQQFPYKVPGHDSKMFFNQYSMSITQFGFLGLVILHPGKFGAARATDEELEGFIHVWKVLGYLLGVEDKYNFCNGSLSEVKRRCQDLINFWVVPNFLNLTAEWEHYSRCVVKGVSFYVPGNSFEVSILYLCYVLDINARKICSTTSWRTYFRYLFFKFTLCCALRVPWLLNLANWSLKKSLGKAKNYSDERLGRITEISNNYMSL